MGNNRKVEAIRPIRRVQKINRVTPIEQVRRVAPVAGVEGPTRLATEMGAVNVSAGGRSAQHVALTHTDHQAVIDSPAVLTLPLTVTLIGSTLRTPDDALALIDAVNAVFAQAAIHFEVAEMADYESDLALVKQPNGQWHCPFGEDVDHTVACLHLGLVHDLVGVNHAVCACGRCLLVPDLTSNDDFRSASTALAYVLGLSFCDKTLSDRLMAGGRNGTVITPPECNRLRYHVCHLLGMVPEHKRQLSVRVWGYEVVSPELYKTRRREGEAREIFEAVDKIWSQADIRIDFHAWCHLQQDELSSNDWLAVAENGLVPESARFERVIAHDPRALHIFFVSSPIGKSGVMMDKQRGILVIRDQAGRPVRPLAHTLGRMLGLPNQPEQPELLMCVGVPGTLLTPREVETARQSAARLANVLLL